MAKVQALLILTLIAVVQMYEMDFGYESADYQDDLNNEAGLEMYHRQVKRNGPSGRIWGPRVAMNNNGGCVQCCAIESQSVPTHNGAFGDVGGSNDGLGLPNGPWGGSQVASAISEASRRNGPWRPFNDVLYRSSNQKLNQISSSVNGGSIRSGPFRSVGGGRYRLEEDNYISNKGQGSVVGNGPWRSSQKVITQQMVRNGPWKEVQTPMAYKGPNHSWKVSKVSMTSTDDNEVPGWLENSDQICKLFSTMKGARMVVEISDSEGNGKDITLDCRFMPEEKYSEEKEAPTQYLMDDRKRDVVKQAYFNDPKQERHSSKSIKGNWDTKDKTKGKVNRIRITLKPGSELNQRNSLKTGMAKTI